MQPPWPAVARLELAHGPAERARSLRRRAVDEVSKGFTASEVRSPYPSHPRIEVCCEPQ